MTAQDHIQALGSAMVECETAIETMEKVLRTLKRRHREMHGLMDAAQTAYQDAHGNVVLFSGGTSKPPPPPDPDEPVGP